MRLPRHSRGLIGLAVFLAAWQAVFVSGLLDGFLFPAPRTVLSRLSEIMLSGEILPDFASTLAKILVSIIAGFAAGTATGALLSKSDAAYDSAFPLLDFFRSIPATALFPLFMLVFGVGDRTNIALATWVCALFLSLHVAKGLRSTRETSIAIAKTFKKSELEILLNVKFMEALPAIFLGLRTATSLTVVLVIVTEMFVGTTSGLGRAIINSAYAYDIPKLYATIILVGITGYLLNLALAKAEEKMLHWHGK